LSARLAMAAALKISFKRSFSKVLPLLMMSLLG
jgi:hypothetical protein